MATYVRTASNQWKATLRLQGHPTKSKTFRLRRDAELWALQTEDAMRRNAYVDQTASARLCFGEALDTYLATVTSQKKQTTQHRERSCAKNLRAFFSDYALGSIKPRLITEYRSRREAAGKSADTIRLELAMLSHLFTKALRTWDLGLTVNPVALVEKPRKTVRDRRLNGWRETKRLFRACGQHSNPQLLWMVKIALYTAMRKDEIRQLKIGQVDLTSKHILLHGSKTKNGKSRIVPLSERAERILRQAIANPLRPKGCDFVFFGEPGLAGRQSAYVIDGAWPIALERAGIKNLRFHDLRHEAISVLVESGRFHSDLEIMAISGHTSTEMLKRYTHLRSRRLVDKMRRHPLTNL